MTSTATHRHARAPFDDPRLTPGSTPEPLGRLGIGVTDHARLVTGVWPLLIIGLGAPQVEHSLSGAGWQADGSESVAARELAQDHFGGNASSAVEVVVQSSDGPDTEGKGAEVLAEVTELLRDEPRIADVVAPMSGATLSQGGSTAIVLAGAGADTNEIVRVAAGRPLILLLAGLVASAGSLVLINELVPVSIWAMNFA